MKKRILVSVDAGETRVAMLESKGSARPSGRRRGRRPARDRAGSGGAAEDAARPAEKNGDWKVAELYVERRGQRSIVGSVRCV